MHPSPQTPPGDASGLPPTSVPPPGGSNCPDAEPLRVGGLTIGVDADLPDGVVETRAPDGTVTSRVMLPRADSTAEDLAVVCGACGKDGVVVQFDEDRGFLVRHPGRGWPCRVTVPAVDADGALPVPVEISDN